LAFSKTALPVFTNKAPFYRKRSIVFHQVTFGKKTGEQTDGMKGQWVPVQVVDKKSMTGIFLHPAKHAGQFFFSKMMAEQGGKNKVRTLQENSFTVI
jgi:hypothetical protein